MTLPPIDIPAVSAFLKALGGALKTMLDMRKSGKAATAVELREWFEQSIRPAYENLKLIDQDYRDQFRRIAEALRGRGDVQEAARLLRRERPNKLLARLEVRSTVKELLAYQLDTSRKPELAQLLFDFASAISAYLFVASPVPFETYYTHFIEVFDNAVAAGRDPLTRDYSATGHEDMVERAASELEEAIKVMPRKLEAVHNAYVRLRAKCIPLK